MSSAETVNSRTPITSLADRTSSPDPRWLALPQPVRLVYSEHEYAWLSDSEKAALVSSECEPEVAD